MTCPAVLAHDSDVKQGCVDVGIDCPETFYVVFCQLGSEAAVIRIDGMPYKFLRTLLDKVSIFCHIGVTGVISRY